MTTLKDEFKWKRDVQLKYDLYARTYDVLYRSEQWDKYKLIVENLKSKLKCRVLVDAGCGTGLLYEYLSKYSFDIETYVGLDISFEMVKRAKSKFSNVINVDLINADIEYTPLRSSCSNITLSITVFNNLYDIDRGLNELLRITKPGGTVIVTIFKRGEKVEEVLDRVRGKFKRLPGESKDYMFSRVKA